MPLDRGQDETSSTRCRFDPCSSSRSPEGLPDKRLALRGSSPLYSRTKSICFFADTNCEVYEVPLDLGTNDMGALHMEHRTL